MCQDCLAESSVGHPTKHCDLYTAHNLSRAHAERREAENTIAVAFHQTLEESARFHEAPRPQHRRHRNLEESIGNVIGFRFLLSYSNPREFGICEEAERHLPAGGCVVPAEDVIANHAEVIFADVCELRASSDFSHRPHAWSGRLQAFVYLDISALCKFHSGEFQPDVFRVRHASRCNQEMCALQHFLEAILVKGKTDRLS